MSDTKALNEVTAEQRRDDPQFSRARQARILPADMHDRIEQWHDLPADDPRAARPLHEFLGMPYEDYIAWIEGRFGTPDRSCPVCGERDGFHSDAPAARGGFAGHAAARRSVPAELSWKPGEDRAGA